MTKKVLVCGGRDFKNYEYLRDTLDRIICNERGWITEKDEYGNYLPDVFIIAGGARGADTLAVDWAVVNWQPYREFKARWDLYGNSAGHIRNQEMLDKGKPDLVIAFPGGRGTANMVSQARKAGVEVIEVA